MIKCDGFGKLLKPLFSILSIGFFGLLGNSFVRADYSSQLPYNFYIDSNFETIYKNLSFQSDLGNWLFKEYSSDIVRSFFWNNGRLYTYFYNGSNASENYQGYFDKVCKFYDEDGILDTDGFCSSSISYTTENLTEFYSLPDYNFTRAISPTYAGFNLYAPVLCFYNERNKYYYCFNLENHNGGSLNILGLVKDFSAYAENSPFGNGFGGNIVGESSNSVNVSLSGNLMYNNSCTNGYIISRLKSLYGNNLINVCYAGTYDTGLIDNSFIGVPYLSYNGLSYKELFKLTSDGMGWSSWFSTYEDEMLRYKNGSLNVNPFLSRPIALYSYFENLYNGGFLGWDNSNGMGSFLYLNYCNLYFNSDYNSIYSGSYFKSYCDDLNYSSSSDYNFSTGEIGSIDDEEILPPGFDLNNNSSSNVVGVSWDGTLSGESNLKFDGKNFINSFYQKLQSSYQKPLNNSLGFLPTYILVFLCGLILFRFISH